MNPVVFWWIWICKKWIQVGSDKHLWWWAPLENFYTTEAIGLMLCNVTGEVEFHYHISKELEYLRVGVHVSLDTQWKPEVYRWMDLSVLVSDNFGLDLLADPWQSSMPVFHTLTECFCLPRMSLWIYDKGSCLLAWMNDRKVCLENSPLTFP